MTWAEAIAKLREWCEDLGDANQYSIRLIGGQKEDRRTWDVMMDCIAVARGTEVEAPQFPDAKRKPGQLGVELVFYTAVNRYTVTVFERANGAFQMKCMAHSRMARAGETWLRGNKLPDGPFSREAWNAIMAAVVRYELVKIHTPAEAEE